MTVSAVRSLIVNADDFGQSPAINRGIIRAYEKGVVTSASLMVLWPATSEAATYARAHPSLSVGLHVDLGEWIYRAGRWEPLYERVSLRDREAVTQEVACQLDLFLHLVGVPPTHLDSHQHVHSQEPVRSVMVETARDLGIPLRGCHEDLRTYGGFYGQTAEGQEAHQAIAIDQFLLILADLPVGVTELTCHPAEQISESDRNEPETMYRLERSLELDVLCDPRVQALVAAHGIQLCSFKTFRRS
jgi:predicted glycoside hydrolase/deacetylase ChbG (UPF0249 family)